MPLPTVKPSGDEEVPCTEEPTPGPTPSPTSQVQAKPSADEEVPCTEEPTPSPTTEVQVEPSAEEETPCPEEAAEKIEFMSAVAPATANSGGNAFGMFGLAGSLSAASLAFAFAVLAI
jgi:hypothetical protein